MDFIAKEITLGTLVFIYTIYGNVVGPMFGFVWGMRSFYRAMADFQDLFEYGKVENEIEDKFNAEEIKIEKGTVEFKKVYFGYQKRQLFRDFNLKIKANEKVALVGHSGSGKTTLVKLINRFYDVSSGAILIDGKDIRNFKQESVREQTGIVPQECILFDDTIYNNIKFSNPKASRREVIRAIKLAKLDEVIREFPKKENTIVGERGVKLSGGEKQRVSIARSILANKKILILDEATSSLDSETEHKIQEALAKLLEGRTSIIIAHRLSTIMNADRIIVMKRGDIIQEGKHFELIKQLGEYKKLWDLQKGGYL
ncbi:MAG: ATP-binding cassette domain-containing protein [Nanoarchaeota archaeon]|nr:ATP-binding cassette domain-containing protein [Nanoarchaeota archaeon]MBU1027732.1 ATP-binding cassette domain-containing protein [Nanoarchaeota archaeon]